MNSLLFLAVNGWEEQEFPAAAVGNPKAGWVGEPQMVFELCQITSGDEAVFVRAPPDVGSILERTIQNLT